MNKKIASDPTVITITSPAGIEYFPAGIEGDPTPYNVQLRAITPAFYASHYGVTGSGDETTEVQAALDAAAGARLYVDKSITTTQVTIADDTEVIYLKGTTHTLAAAADVHAIVNDDQAGGNSNITIMGLRLDANRANQSTGLSANVSHGIYMLNVTGLQLYNVTVSEAMDDALKLDEITGLVARTVKVDGAGTDGISLDNSSDIDWIGLRIYNVDGTDGQGNDRPGAGSCYGAEFEDGVQEGQFSHLYFENCSRAGSLNIQSHGTDRANANLVFANVIIRDSSNLAVNIGGHATYPTTDVTITGLTLTNCEKGIRFLACSDVRISDFELDVTAVASGTDYGLWFDGNCSHVHFAQGHIVSNNQPVQVDSGLTLSEITFSQVWAYATGSGRGLQLDSDIPGFSWDGGGIIANTHQAMNVNAVFTDRAMFHNVTFFALDTSAVSGASAVVYFQTAAGGVTFMGCRFKGGDGVLGGTPEGLLDLEGNNVNVTVVGSYFYSANNDRAILVDAGSLGITIVGNEIEHCSTGSTYAIHSNAQQSVITNNRISGCNRAILVNSDNNICTNNVIDGAATNFAVVDNGTGNTVSPNIVTNPV